LAQLARATREIQGLNVINAGKVVLGVLPTIAPYLLPHILESFAARCSNFELNIHEDMTVALLRLIETGAVDFGIMSLPINERGFEIEELFSEDLLVALPSKHPLAGKSQIHVKDLRSEQFILMHEGHYLGDQLLGCCQRHDFQPRILTRSGQLETIQSLVGAGMGISLIPRMAMLKAGERVQYRLLKNQQPRRGFPSLQNVGRNYLLNLLGIMIWPLGWGVAGLITQGMIDFMTDQSFLSSQSAPGALGYSLQNLMGLAFLGIWIIFSTIAAPVIIQKAIATGNSVASSLFGGAFSAGRAAATTGASTFAEGGGAGIKSAIAAGAMATAAAGESLATSSMGEGGNSLLGSLAQTNNRAHQRERDNEGQKKQPGFPPNDPTGDKSVAGLLDKSRSANA